MSLYPLKFEPIYKEKIWGGENLKKYLNKDLQGLKKVGESWEISDHFDDNSIVINGELKGKSLHSILKDYGRDLIGNKADDRFLERFPLLIKFIDANDKLSVQVHPDDEYANKNENGEFGKTEMWYIVHAEEDAKLIAGVKEGITKEKFKELLEANKLEEALNYVAIKTGDAIYIPAGRLHAILPGIVINEIQQNSDVTYRVYDWGRVGMDGKPRELHIDKSLDVINFNDTNIEKLKFNEVYNSNEGKIIEVVKSNFFNVDKIVVKSTISFKEKGETFFSYSVIDGEGEILWSDNKIDIKKGESFLIPASVKEYSIKSLHNNLVLIRSYL